MAEMSGDEISLTPLLLNTSTDAATTFDGEGQHNNSLHSTRAPLTPLRVNGKSSNNVKSPSPSRPSSRPVSRTNSPSRLDSMEDVPNNVNSKEQLKLLPDECLSGDPDRPLRHVDEAGQVSFYALEPMFYSVIFILLIELVERFSFYGVNYTLMSFLTGGYNSEWNAGMHAVSAASYVSLSTAMAYSTPFVGALLADAFLGEYWSILVGASGLYLPGLCLIASTTIPQFLGSSFNESALAFGMLVLWPFGTGIVKSAVNVFGAKQFHPWLQSSLIESYYINFYMSINIGALAGGFVVPLLAQHDITLAYFLPVFVLTLGIVIFLMGSPRYVKAKPRGSLFPIKQKYTSASLPTEPIDLTVMARISLLIVPFTIAYSQISTTFIVQGTVMKKAFGFVDAAFMNNGDAIAILVFGSLIAGFFYPWLQQRGIRVPTTYKFAIGSAFGVLAISWSLLVERMIHLEFERTGKQISILWQTMSYVLIGIGEIFTISSAYEAAFTTSPPEKKVLASAITLCCIGSIPNMSSIFLYQICRPWFRNSKGTTNITHLEDYATAHVGRYFWVLFGIAILGVVINLHPRVRKFVESIEDRAQDMLKSPKTPVRPPHLEESTLLQIKRHKAYLQYGSTPVLYKQGSMRAGPSLKKKAVTQRALKRSAIAKLYRRDPSLMETGLVLSVHGLPIRAGDLKKNRSVADASLNSR